MQQLLRDKCVPLTGAAVPSTPIFRPRRLPKRFPWGALLSGLVVLALTFVCWHAVLDLGAGHPYARPLRGILLVTGSITAVFIATLIGRSGSDYISLLAEASRIRTRIDDILESITEAFLSLDNQWRIIYLNSHAEDTFGVRRDDVLGRSLWRLLPSGPRREMTRHLVQVRDTQTAVHFELPGIVHSGRCYEVHAYPAEDGLSIYIQDITKRKEAETRLLEQARQLAEADHRKDEFLAMLAHELRNPLAPIRNAVQVLRVIGSQEPAALRQKEIIDRQVAHMARLLDDLLDVSRITRGKIKLRKERLDLCAIIEQAVDISRPAAQSHGLAFHNSLPPEPLWVEGDATRLDQILRNLIHNAIKYTESGGNIWVEAQYESDGHGPAALIRIRDTGIGIPQQILPRIFDLFAQADQSLDRSQGGLGIGLTLVHRLVELHGGSIEAFSEGEGHGSQFTVRLPLLPAVAAVSSPSTEASPQAPAKLEPNGSSDRISGSLKVLVVDDNLDSVHSLKDLLRVWGYDVRIAYSGTQALAEAADFHPEVVLLDIGLPEMSGYEVARRLRRLESLDHAVLVALTGYGQDQDRRKAHEAGFDRHFTKPVNLQELRILLNQCATQRSAA